MTTKPVKPSGPSIDLIHEQLLAVQALYESDAPEAAEAPLDEWFSDLAEMLDEKLIAYKFLIKKAKADAEYNKDLAASFTAHRKRHENFEKMLRKRLTRFMVQRHEQTGETYLRTKSCTVQLQWTERKIEITNHAALLEQGLAYQITTIEIHGTNSFEGRTWMKIRLADWIKSEVRIEPYMDKINARLDDGEFVEGIKVTKPEPFIRLT